MQEPDPHVSALGHVSEANILNDVKQDVDADIEEAMGIELDNKI